MAALSLHHAVFSKEKDPIPLRSASSFLQSASERDGSPTSQLFSSVAYQDLIQRQPTHPDGPATGWDLGLNLLGDPVTAAEHNSSEVHQVKMKLRRLHATTVALELLFGVWGAYTTVRYCLAFANSGGDDAEHACALVLGIVSAFALALVISSGLMPLLPQKGNARAWRYARLLHRMCYLVLLCACAVMNLILVLIRRASELCGWDIDISWHTDMASSSCHHTASFAAWVTAAILRLVVMSVLALLFIYVLRSYYGTRHPVSKVQGPKYTPYLSSDPEELSPVSASLHHSKSSFKFSRSQDSNHTLNRSSITLPKSSSISTLAPSTSCTGHSRSHSTPPSSKDISPPRISPPTSRWTSSTHATHHGPSVTPSQPACQSPGSEVMAVQTQQPVSGITVPSPASHLLRRMSRLSVTHMVAPFGTTSDVASSRSERLCGPTISRDPSEIRSGAPWKSSHRGTGVYLDAYKKATDLVLEHHTAHVRHGSQTSGTVSETFSPSHEDGRSIQEKAKDGNDGVVYDYGYGASGHTYPYLDMYNPQRPGGGIEALSSSTSLSCDTDTRGSTQGQRRVIPSRPGTLDVLSSEPRPSLPRDHEALGTDTEALASDDDDEQSSADEAEEEYVAMMGGFVRRMATIESLGSKEAAGTLSSSRTGSVALRTAASLSSASSHFSSVRFAMHGSGSGSGSPSGSGSGFGNAFQFGFGSSSRSRSRSGTSSFGAMMTPSLSSGHTGSGSTAYLSFSSSGTDMMHVNERGELLPSSGHGRSTSSLSTGRASGP